MLVKQPVKEFVTVEAIGALALYLASDQAANEWCSFAYRRRLGSTIV